MIHHLFLLFLVFFAFLGERLDTDVSVCSQIPGDAGKRYGHRARTPGPDHELQGEVAIRMLSRVRLRHGVRNHQFLPRSRERRRNRHEIAVHATLELLLQRATRRLVRERVASLDVVVEERARELGARGEERAQVRGRKHVEQRELGLCGGRGGRAGGGAEGGDEGADACEFFGRRLGLGGSGLRANGV